MEKMILQKVFQMFILGMEGTKLSENPNFTEALKNNLGGVILFTQNIQSKDQTKSLIKDIKNLAKTPVFVSIDQEGGRVERTENIFGGKKFLSAKFAAEKGENFLIKQTEQISQLLKDLGFNLNYAPVLDVNTNPNNPIIGERAYSDKTEDVIKYADIVNKTYLKNGIITCAKHFPGHGDANVDSHKALPDFDLALEKMEKTHIKPYLHIKTPLVMVAHLHCKAFYQEKIPASLSKNVIDYLRSKINFDGLVITDDMIMKGVEQGVNSAVKAIKAGVNILLYRNSCDETVEIIRKIADLAQKDTELLEKINLSYEKIISYKKTLPVG